MSDRPGSSSVHTISGHVMGGKAFHLSKHLSSSVKGIGQQDLSSRSDLL